MWRVVSCRNNIPFFITEQVYNCFKKKCFILTACDQILLALKCNKKCNNYDFWSSITSVITVTEKWSKSHVIFSKVSSVCKRLLIYQCHFTVKYWKKFYKMSICYQIVFWNMLLCRDFNYNSLNQIWSCHVSSFQACIIGPTRFIGESKPSLIDIFTNTCSKEIKCR